MVAILDYAMGNLGAHLNMMRKIGFTNVVVTSSGSVLERAEKIIIPGVGSFDAGMNNLRRLGIIDVLNYKVMEEKVPVLGICLGMHLFTMGSEEGSERGMGWIDTRVKRFEFGDDCSGLKIPHMGWNTVKLEKKYYLFDGMEREENRFYFVHSYHYSQGDEFETIASASYGYDFPAVIRKENIIGAQFHPEKSHKFGISFYRNFINH